MISLKGERAQSMSGSGKIEAGDVAQTARASRASLGPRGEQRAGPSSGTA